MFSQVRKFSSSYIKNLFIHGMWKVKNNREPLGRILFSYFCICISPNYIYIKFYIFIYLVQYIMLVKIKLFGL